jgi:hypothetical protein
VTNIPFVHIRDQIGNSYQYKLTEEGYLKQQERSESGVILPEDSRFDVDAYPEEANRPVVFDEVSGSTDDKESVF